MGIDHMAACQSHSYTIEARGNLIPRLSFIHSSGIYLTYQSPDLTEIDRQDKQLERNRSRGARPHLKLLLPVIDLRGVGRSEPASWLR